MSVYTENGYKNRADYLIGLAEEYGVPLNVVQVHASVLGPNEDFDGLVNAIQDLEGEYEDEWMDDEDGEDGEDDEDFNYDD